MSRTFKDQRRWDYREYWRNMEWSRSDGSPLPHQEPIGHYDIYRFPIGGDCDAKWWYTWSNRKYRRLVKRLIRQNNFDDIPKKPINVDWIIY